MAQQDKQSPVMADAETLHRPKKPKKPGRRRLFTLLALLLVAGAAVGVYFIATAPAPEDTTPSPTLAPLELLVERDRSEFERVTLTVGDDDPYTLIVDEEGVFHVDGSPDYAVTQSKASSLIGTISRLSIVDRLEDVENLADFGLDKPQSTATVTYTDGQTRTFYLGNKAPTTSRYYLMEEGDDTVYLVGSTAGTNLTTTRRSLHPAELVQIASDAIQEVTIDKRDGERITVGYRENEESLGISAVWISEPILYEADGEKLTALFENIAAIRLNSFETDATQEELEGFGLADPRYEVIVQASDAQGNKVEAMHLFIGNDKDDTSTYARIDDTNDVYLLDRQTLAFLADITTTRMIGRFTNIINIDNVDAIDVITDGAHDVLTLTRTPVLDEDGKQKVLTSGKLSYDELFELNGEEVEDKTFRKLYQIIIGTLADGLIPEDQIPSEDVEPVIMVKFSLNSVRDEEIVEFLPYDLNHYAVRRNGECLFYILKTRVDIIPRALEAYKDGTFVPEEFGV